MKLSKVLDYKIIALALLPFILIGFYALDASMAKPQRAKGVVVDKQYVSGSSGSSVGVVSSPNGGVGVVLTPDGPDEFVILVEDNGAVESVICQPSLYYSKSVGDTLYYEIYHGGITGLKGESKGVK